MLKRSLSLCLAVPALAMVTSVLAVPARATILFEANLDNVQEGGSVASTATGHGTVLLNDAMDQITVDESWTGLTAPATASHIHTGAAGTNGPVTFPFSGVPSATAGSIPEQIFAINATQLANLQAGDMYFNIHTPNYPGGEIRGQIRQSTAPVPEPGSLNLLLSAIPGGMLLLRRRKPA